MIAVENRAKFRRSAYLKTALRGRPLPSGYADWDACPVTLKGAWLASVSVYDDRDDAADIDAVMEACRLENDARNAEIDNLRWILGR